MRSAFSALVIDASVALSWAFEDEGDGYADRVLEAMVEAEAYTPGVWPLEVGNGLLAAERRGRLEQAAAVRFLSLLRQLPIIVEVERADLMLGEIMALAREQGLSVYNAAYLHLAMRRGLPLATVDEALRQAAARVRAPLFV